MPEWTSLLHQPLYRMAEVDDLLGTPRGTARGWIDGARRGHRRQAPLIRAERTGSDRVTWGEFVEARLIAEFQDRGNGVFGLRPVIVALRETFHEPHPLAIAHPFLDAEGRRAVLRVQRGLGLDPGLRMVVPNSRTVVLSPEVARFTDVAGFGTDGVVDRVVLEGPSSPTRSTRRAGRRSRVGGYGPTSSRKR